MERIYSSERWRASNNKVVILIIMERIYSTDNEVIAFNQL